MIIISYITKQKMFDPIMSYTSITKSPLSPKKKLDLPNPLLFVYLHSDALAQCDHAHARKPATTTALLSRASNERTMNAAGRPLRARFHSSRELAHTHELHDAAEREREKCSLLHTPGRLCFSREISLCARERECKRDREEVARYMYNALSL